MIKNVAAALTLLAGLCWGGPVRAESGEASFTPTHVVAPVVAIGLVRNDLTQVPLYECPESEDCLLDLTDEAALQAKAGAAADVPIGTYSGVYVKHCRSGDGYAATVEGEVEIGTIGADGAVTKEHFFTSAGPDPLSSAGPAEPVTVQFAGCSTSFALRSPLEVTGGKAVELALFSSYEGLAWVSSGSATFPGCFQGTEHDLCLGYPDVLPVVGAGAVSLERHYILELGPPPLDTRSFGGSVLLLIDQAIDEPIAGFTRAIYSAHSKHATVPFVTTLQVLESNADGSYTLENTGGLDPTTGGTTPYGARFEKFRRGNHSGTYLPGTGVPASVSYVTWRERTLDAPACPDPVYTQAPAALDAAGGVANVFGIHPLGLLAPIDHTLPVPHHYFWLTPENDGLKDAVDIVAPGDLTITEVRLNKEENGWEDYIVRYVSCRSHGGYFAHVRLLAGDVLAAVTAAKEQKKRWICDDKGHCGATLDLKLSAGAPIGTTGGVVITPGDDPRQWDWGARDSRVAEAAFVNPERYPAEPGSLDILHVVSALDYLPSDVGAKLKQQLLTTGGGPALSVGSTMLDVGGTAQGNWFWEGDTESREQRALCLAYDTSEPSIGAFSIGDPTTSFPDDVNQTGFDAERRTFAPTPAEPGHNQPFDAVHPGGGVTCYDGFTTGANMPVGKVILLELVSETELHLKAVDALSCAALAQPWTLPADAVVYRR